MNRFQKQIEKALDHFFSQRTIWFMQASEPMSTAISLLTQSLSAMERAQAASRYDEKTEFDELVPQIDRFLKNLA